MNGQRRRRGAVPPIVTMLMILAFIGATAVVAYWVISTHTRAGRKPLPHLEGGVYVAVDGAGVPQTLYFTLRNDGTSPLDLSDLEVVLPAGTFTATCEDATGAAITSLDPGASCKCSVDLSGAGLAAGSIQDGDEGVIRTPYSDLRFIVEVLKPGGAG